MFFLVSLASIEGLSRICRRAAFRKSESRPPIFGYSWCHYTVLRTAHLTRHNAQTPRLIHRGLPRHCFPASLPPVPYCAPKAAVRFRFPSAIPRPEKPLVHPPPSPAIKVVLPQNRRRRLLHQQNQSQTRPKPYITPKVRLNPLSSYLVASSEPDWHSHSLRRGGLTHT
ncbi:uncharacterized protein LY79DRAFT_321498 [Colletotrichum navitas]|uniref:Uncharacterized protein n=1 Tax=Colletotrichum navitas TaxID=681940 RepID=A0AAD8Q8F2_9PEZI|nr:uncharacterized protein LY79DRAFT_321498 [Colletotrichum navitas]KAK1597900.1 hypothetical protein LY79DRAFT_321498 [Colletotrichum navitas]